MADPDSALTEEDVRTSYNIFLKRHPENDGVIKNHISRLLTRDAFRRTMLTAKEFYDRNYPEVSRYVISASPISSSQGIDVHISDRQLKLLFEHIQNVWTKLGASDPHFSVLSVQKFRSQSILENQNDFYDSGRSELEVMFRRLAALDLHPRADGTAIELGSGVGRVTRYLGERFARVVGYDISANHLALARAYIEDAGVTNVRFEQLVSAQAARFAEHDFFYSRLVLQHNPPPVIAHLLDRVLSRTKPGGIVIFQLMTARTGYTFDTDSYLASMDTLDDQELHVLPQAEVFRLFTKHRITCVEIFRDAALRGFDRTSTAFIGQKAP